MPKVFVKDGLPARVANTPAQEVAAVWEGFKEDKDATKTYEASLKKADEDTKPTEAELAANAAAKKATADAEARAAQDAENAKTAAPKPGAPRTNS